MNPNQNNREHRIKTLEAIHDEAVDAIITIDERGTIESLNPATTSLFGYEPSSLIGKNVKMLMPNPFHDAHDQYLQNYIQSGKRRIIGIGREVVGRKSDGSTFPLHLAVSEITVGNQRKFAGIIRDLSEFKQLEERETSLGRIIEDSLNEIFIFDAESLLFLQVNRGARENIGFSIAELKVMTPADIKPDFTLETFRQTIEPLATGEQQLLEFETTHQRKDGSTYFVEVHLQKSVYKNRPVFIAIILDISRRRQAELEVEKHRKAMQEELEQLVETRTEQLRNTQAELVRSEKFSTLGKVSGGIAHEIKNPLNAVKTSAYYLLNAQNASPEKVREHLERIDRQVTMIDNVVTALSDVAKLPAANLSPVDLEPILRSAIESTELPNNIAVIFDLPPNLPNVLVDESQIVIAIKNLIRNARDAMQNGGELTISAEITDERVKFNFSDTGIGIAAGDLEKILEPLFTTKARGMGLGLTITRAIADKNECTLTIDSAVGKGSTFSIELKR